jgi:N-acetylmuramoyl-L-alanine amidase
MKWFYHLKNLSLMGVTLGTLTLSPFSTTPDWPDSTLFAASNGETSTSTMDSTTEDFVLLEGVKNFDLWARVTNSIANIRTEPHINAPIILKAAQKSLFPIIIHQGKWYKIQLGKDQFGWISDSIVEPKKQLQQHQLVKVKADTRVFTGPDALFISDRKAEAGSDYVPLAVCGRWIQILSDQTGEAVWVSSDSVSWEYGEGTVASVIHYRTGDALRGKTIVIDPGHGGKDVGAVGKVKPIKESDVNLAAANLLEKKFKAVGANVIMTRTSNDDYVSLQDRVDISNQAIADLFISIHQNMYPADPKVSGVNTYYYNSAASKELANDIESQAMISLYPKQNSDGLASPDGLYVLNQTARPSALVEGCFLSNPYELEQSIEPDFHEKLASGVFRGILQYYGIPFSTKPPN